MRRADLVSASVLLVLGLATLFIVIPKYVSGGGQSGELPPAFMPYVAAALGTVAMTLLLVVRLARPGASAAPAPMPAESWVFLGCAAALLGLAFAAMSLVGYVAGAAIVVAGFMALARAGWKALVASALLFPAALWLLFDRLLGFPLP